MINSLFIEYQSKYYFSYAKALIEKIVLVPVKEEPEILRQKSEARKARIAAKRAGRIGRQSTQIFSGSGSGGPNGLSDVSSIFSPVSQLMNLSEISDGDLVFSTSSEAPAMSPKTAEAMKKISV